MSHIHISRTHELGEARVREEIEQLAVRLQREFGASHRWQGNCLIFSRPGVQGQIAVSEEQLEIDIKLGMLYAMMHAHIEKRIINKLDERLAAATPDGSSMTG